MELVLKKNIQWMLNLQKYMIPNVVLKPVYILMRSKMASLFWTVKTVPDFFFWRISFSFSFSPSIPLSFYHSSSFSSFPFQFFPTLSLHWPFLFFLPLPLFSLVSLSPASLSLSLTHRSLSIYFLSSLLYPILRRIVGHIKADSKNLHLILHFDNFCKMSSSRKRDQFRNSINIFLFRLNGCW